MKKKERREGEENTQERDTGDKQEERRIEDKGQAGGGEEEIWRRAGWVPWVTFPALLW